MRLTERKVCFPSCDKQGNLTSVDYIEIKNKNLAEEKLCQLEDIEDELGIDLITLLERTIRKVMSRELSLLERFERLMFFSQHISHTDNEEIIKKDKEQREEDIALIKTALKEHELMKKLKRNSKR